MDIQLAHLQDKESFIAKVNSDQATLKYRKFDETTLEYFSTFVPEEIRGGKVGYQLVVFGLEYAKENNYKVIPTCWFVKKVMERKEEYQTMIAS